ncbi:hypothetical protein DFS33DRAFT_1303974 [Desarmillaria ectypa]|nr:hypothetical protein DFS33DRAFT_1303974 [Desarmillaria ectypa]
MAYSYSQVNSLLLGSSAKCLCPRNFLPPPLVLEDPDVPDAYVPSPQLVKSTTIRYFMTLYTKDLHSPQPKPWMDSLSVLAIRQRTASDPFQWLQLLDIAVLRRGSTRPAPGTDC